MKYELLYETSVSRLNKAVQEKLDAGWDLHGSPGSAETSYWYQAVVYRFDDLEKFGIVDPRKRDDSVPLACYTDCLN